MNLPVLGGAAVGTLYAVLCVAAGAGGLALLQRLAGPLAIESTLLRNSARFALGHALLGTSWMGFALAGGLTRTTVLVVCGCVFLASAIACGILVVNRRRSVRREPPDPLPASRDTVLLLLPVVAACILVFLRALYPPMLDDPRQIYLVTPRVVAETGRLTFQPFNHHMVYPLLAEMNEAAVLVVANETAATVLDAWVAMSLMAAVSGLARQAGCGTAGRLVALLTVLTSSAFLNLMGSCKVDIAGAQYAILALQFALQGRLGSLTSSTLTGLFAGAALAVKYTLFTVLPGIAVLAGWPARGRPGGPPLGPRWRFVLVTALASCVFLVPQFLKDGLLVGNPVAPFLSGLFGTSDAYWTRLLSAEYSGSISRLTPLQVLAYPFTITYAALPNMLGNASPLYLALLPILIGTGFGTEQQRRLAIAAVVMMSAWMVVYPLVLMPRVHFAALACLAVVVGSIGERLLRAPLLRQTLGLCLAALCVMMILGLRTAVYGVLYAGGRIERARVYSDSEHFLAAEFLNQRVQRGARVFLEGIQYRYFLDTRILVGSQTEAEMQNAFEGCAGRETVLREGGFRWLVTAADVTRCPAPDGFEPVVRHGGLTVFTAREPLGRSM